MESTNRREFLSGLIRSGLLGGLGLVGALLVWRSWKEGACFDGDGCTACRAYAACPIRQARPEAGP